MIRKINTIDDVKAELYRYFEIQTAIPEPPRPDWAKNYLWQLVVSEPNDDDIVAASSKFYPTQVDIADYWYMAFNWMPILSKFEFDLIRARFKPKPMPWKLLEREHHLTRQMLRLYIDKGLKRILSTVKE